MEAIKSVEVLKSGLEVDGKPIPPGIFFSATEVFNEEGVPFYYLQSELWGEVLIKKIMVFAFNEIGVLKIHKGRSEKKGDCENLIFNEFPEVVNLAPLPGNKPFF